MLFFWIYSGRKVVVVLNIKFIINIIKIGIKILWFFNICYNFCCLNWWEWRFFCVIVDDFEIRILYNKLVIFKVE